MHMLVTGYQSLQEGPREWGWSTVTRSHKPIRILSGIETKAACSYLWLLPYLTSLAVQRHHLRNLPPGPSNKGLLRRGSEREGHNDNPGKVPGWADGLKGPTDLCRLTWSWGAHWTGKWELSSKCLWCRAAATAGRCTLLPANQAVSRGGACCDLHKVITESAAWLCHCHPWNEWTSSYGTYVQLQGAFSNGVSRNQE